MMSDRQTLHIPKTSIHTVCRNLPIFETRLSIVRQHLIQCSCQLINRFERLTGSVGSGLGPVRNEMTDIQRPRSGAEVNVMQGDRVSRSTSFSEIIPDH